MKNYWLIIIIVFLKVSCFAQQSPAVNAGREGIYIFCGNELPKTFQYVISRREATSSTWTELAQLHFPKNRNEWSGRMVEAALKNGNSSIADSARIAFGWSKLNRAAVLDSAYVYAPYTEFQVAGGTGFWDRTARKGMQFQYKIDRVSRERTGSLPSTTLIPGSFSWPGRPSGIGAMADTLIAAGRSVEVAWSLSNEKQMKGCRVFRSLYLKDIVFKEIHPTVLYFNKGSKQIVNIIDESVVNGAQYSYYIIPYDHYGNESGHSDTINVFNQSVASMKPIVVNLKGESREKENMIRLSWKVNNSASLISVDIYKSLSMDGDFYRVASIPPKDTVYNDYRVTPVETYYYSLVLNAPYGKSFPSARIPVTFKANRSTAFPPKNLTAVRRGNVVQLQWTRGTDDTRAYYVYRSGSYSEKMLPVGQIVVNSDSIVTYVDSVGGLLASQVWIYAVASENTSYAISPLSSRATVVGNSGRLPIPSGLNARVDLGGVQLIWKGSTNSVPGRGYLVTRKEADDNYQSLSNGKSISFETGSVVINSYMDSTATPGNYYSYSVQFLGVNGDSSSPSLPAGIFIPSQVPPSPNNVIALMQSGNVLLQWTLPLGDTWDEIRVYRASAGGTSALIKTLKADEVSYTDNTVKKGENYFYWIATAKKGVEGRIAEPLGIRVE